MEYMADPITNLEELKEHSSNPDSDRHIPSCMELYIMSLQVLHLFFGFFWVIQQCIFQNGVTLPFLLLS